MKTIKDLPEHSQSREKLQEKVASVSAYVGEALTDQPQNLPLRATDRMSL